MSGRESNPVLRIQSLSASYGDSEALHDITLTVRPGEIMGLIGPNGAGKSSLIKVISGVLRADSGDVLVGGKSIKSLSPAERARMVAVVPQAHQLGGAFTVRRTVLLGRTAYLGFLGNPEEQDLEIVDWAMKETSVAFLAERKLAEISGGEQQRVLLARALAQKSSVLLLDEPTNHLDLKYQVDLLRLLRILVREQGLSVMMAMHDLNQVSGVVDRVAMLVGGVLQCVGKPEEVLTPEFIHQAYQIEVETFTHPGSGKHYLFPRP